MNQAPTARKTFFLFWSLVFLFCFVFRNLLNEGLMNQIPTSLFGRLDKSSPYIKKGGLDKSSPCNLF